MYRFKCVYTGRIERADSIFKYTEDTTFETFDRRKFEPLFLQEVLDQMTDNQRQLVEKKCNGNNECIFDYAITGKYGVANIAKIMVCSVGGIVCVFVLACVCVS